MKTSLSKRIHKIHAPKTTKMPTRVSLLPIHYSVILSSPQNEQRLNYTIHASSVLFLLYFFLKRRWAGHVARMEDKRWAKITTERYPRGCKRARGKPKRRWGDEIEEKVGNNWMRIALDRVAWRQLWRASASSGMTG